MLDEQGHGGQRVLLTEFGGIAFAPGPNRTWGYARVGETEREPERCRRENTTGPAVLARACARRGLALLTFSSDLVFDGRRATPYREGDGTAPLNIYGRSQAEAEDRVLGILPSALVVRAGALFGPWDEHNFVAVSLRALARRRPVVAAEDKFFSPIYVPDLVHGCLDLLIDGEQGLWHLANPGVVSWTALARQAAALAGLDSAGVWGRPASALGLAAPRPAYSALGSERGVRLPPLDDALRRYGEATGRPAGARVPRADCPG